MFLSGGTIVVLRCKITTVGLKKQKRMEWAFFLMDPRAVNEKRIAL